MTTREEADPPAKQGASGKTQAKGAWVTEEDIPEHMKVATFALFGGYGGSAPMSFYNDLHFMHVHPPAMFQRKLIIPGKYSSFCFSLSLLSLSRFPFSPTSLALSVYSYFSFTLSIALWHVLISVSLRSLLFFHILILLSLIISFFQPTR